MKKAIVQVADQGPLDSLVVMLATAGYRCYLPSTGLKNTLRKLGCDTVLDISMLIDRMGYEKPITLPETSVVPESTDLTRCDLYVDVKAHRNAPKIWQAYPRLKNKTLWYRINGGQPEHVIRRDEHGNVKEDCGDEMNPVCPILTPNLWYREQGPWSNKAYACWPPFYRFNDYYKKLQRPYDTSANHTNPICLIHNLRGWGYGELIDPMRKLGIRCVGDGSPDGLVSHSQVPKLLSTSLAMVHLKSSDAPGYALYEALAAGCPVICSRRLIWKNKMDDLLIPNKTCLVFDRIGHQGLTGDDVKDCIREISDNLKRLEDPGENKRIGMAGHIKLLEVMWSDVRIKDVDSLRDFMNRNFG